ncbi:MAG: MBL fold metallo-hydrolase [Phycisphaerales bacterium]
MIAPESPSLCVLSSSSGGNCSVVTWVENTYRRAIFVDLGLSPGRSRKILRSIGLKQTFPDAVVLTHLDEDHWNPTWVSFLPRSCTIYIHRRHRNRAARVGVLRHRTTLFDETFSPFPGVDAEALLCPHDDLGSAAFRFTVKDSRLGYATDLGRASGELAGFLKGVGTLAVESNYCPLMQEASARPRSVKERVTGGAGHLSNQECAQLCRDVGPVEHVVLLHLSRQCNRPELALAGHGGAPYALTLAGWNSPTPFIPIAAGTPDSQRTWFRESLFSSTRS